jgi:hypothetical protein
MVVLLSIRKGIDYDNEVSLEGECRDNHALANPAGALHGRFVSEDEDHAIMDDTEFR